VLAAQRTAAAEKLKAERDAAEAAQREKAKADAERLAKEGDAARSKDAAEMRAGEKDAAQSRQRQAAAEQYQEARARESQFEAERGVKPEELAAGAFRNGEVSVAAPLGFQKTNYTSGPEGRFSYGIRADLRIFTWLKKTNGHGQPPAGNGFEFAVGGGIATTISLGSQSASTKTNIASGSLRARYWHNVAAIGVFGEWTHYGHALDMGRPSESHSLYALGPELAFGIVASRAIALEASVRAGAAASGNGLAFDTSKDLFVGAHAVAELGKLYGAASATRYVTSSAGLESSWNAMGMIGMRLPF